METRTIKELLQLMLDYQNYYSSGLCRWIKDLLINNIISGLEYGDLSYYISKNRPSIFSSFDAFNKRNSVFYWKSGDIEPRIKWIKKHIKLNS